ncbi:phosphomannomutase/phosphoglucomutase [uncultured Spongiibacter sp.]|uniref:phosphomannomutase/phosphoglucomutase n=1 Tax=uncultured Spongiibacter sp. TaxID=870896 RepID=UPI0025828853|nr:phosphomannomutase/phosphoglucomutase [uncultured Spongiibacter sp.]
MTKKRSAKAAVKFPLSPARRDILASGIVCAALIIGAFYWIQTIELPRSLNQNVIGVTSNIAEHQRKVVIDVVDSIGKRVSAQAASPAIAEALIRGDQQRLKQQERDLQRSFPAAIDAKLIQLGDQGIADERSQTDRLRNHIEIDMLRKATDTGKLTIEAYRHDGQWIISMLQQVNARGAIIVSFDSQFFARILRNIAGTSVHSELVQRYKDREDIVIAADSKQFSEYMVSRNLPVPGWTLHVLPQSAMLETLRVDGTLIWLAGLLCLGIIVGSHSIFFLRADQQQSSPAPQPAPATKSPPPSLEQQLARKLAARKPSESDQGTAPFNPQGSLTPPLPEAAPLRKKAAAHAEPPAPQPAADTEPEESGPALALNCFRAYDIRGIADRDLSDAHCVQIGLALGSEAQARGHSKMLLGRDGRNSSPRIREALLKGLLGSGVDVVDLGIIATPMLNFACYDLNIGSAVMITGSHNPADHNGMKMLLDFQSLTSDDIQSLARRIESQNFASGDGQLSNDSIEQRYIDRICSDVVVAQSLKVVIDAGNGATANIVVPLFEELGCEVVPLFCNIDGSFPNRDPDPTIPEHLDALAAAISEHQADIGIAFDGDGDRVAVVSASGRRPRADELLMLLADDMVSRNPGCEVLFDVKCSRLLSQLIVNHGGRPTMWKCGHSHMKRKMADSDALLGGEFSGHIFFKERWYGFDDGMYAAARLLEALTLAGTTLDDELAGYPSLHSSPEILIAVDDERKFSLVQSFANHAKFDDAQLIDIDGLRYEFRNGWGLLRASNTGPAISLRFEADSPAALDGIRESFAQTLAKIDPTLADGL